jgi:hypothetical protein
MSTITVTSDQLTVRLPWLHKVLGLLRDQDVPRSAVTAVDVVPDGVAAVRGIRAPGLALPGRRVGTWRQPGAKRFVDVRKGQPALRVTLSGGRYDELLLGTDDPEAFAAQLRD